ncbi:MAG: exodeoxyribonuclease VII small subunit [Clostridia bacterium]|nr:exodeoxyribonuclease VII small subunit [Clostridia bacterium]MBQ3077381.1 exodeoxyribonuclease VII small subunit [Clostridia bacterium]
MNQEQQPMEFEKALARLEEIVRALETGSASLDQSLRLFEEGVGLTARCNALLDQAEQNVQMLVRGEDGAMQPRPMPEMPK